MIGFNAFLIPMSLVQRVGLCRQETGERRLKKARKSAGKKPCRNHGGAVGEVTDRAARITRAVSKQLPAAVSRFFGGARKIELLRSNSIPSNDNAVPQRWTL